MSDNKKGRVWRGEDGDWYWTLSLSSDAVSRSTEGYRNRAHAIEQFTTLHPDAVLEVEDTEGDVTTYPPAGEQA